MQYKTTTITIQTPLNKQYFIFIGLTHIIIGVTLMIFSGILIVFAIRSVAFHFF
jgi:hypothetical protein